VVEFLVGRGGVLANERLELVPHGIQGGDALLGRQRARAAAQGERI
jgi:hypothetical protein